MIIVVPVVNNPDFIEIQHECLKKHMKSAYEYVVFNDAKDFPDFTNGGDVSMRQQIRDTCSRLGVLCVDIPNAQHLTNKNAMLRCADSYNFILEFMKKYPEEYLVLDSDMFLITDFYGDEYKNMDVAIVLQKREESIYYFWNGLFYFNMKKIKNQELLNWSPLIQTDVGGAMIHWLVKQTNTVPNTDEIRLKNITFKHDNIYYIRHLWSCSWDASEMTSVVSENKKLKEFIENDPRNKNGKYFCEIYDDRFLHYRAGGNWLGEGLELHRRLTADLKAALAE
jgi:hypothetical protein